MNNVYLYDGSFEQLIILIFTLIKHNKEPIDIKRKDEYISNLIDKPTYLKFNNVCKKMEYIKKALGYNILGKIYYTYLSNNKDKEIILYNFVKNALIYKNDILERRNIDSVNSVLKISKYVNKEAHHMKGFLRFKKMKNFYYAKMEPTNNLISILANHFKRRLSNEYWLIHDTKRGLYAAYDLNKISYLKDNEVIGLNLEISNEEEIFENLWKTFFHTIAIKERKNKKAQMNFMPKKYWKNIIEMEDEL